MKTQSKKPHIRLQEDTPETGGASVSSQLKDIGKDSWEEFFKDLIGSGSKDVVGQLGVALISGELHEGQEISLNKQPESPQKADKSPESASENVVLGREMHQRQVAEVMQRESKHSQQETMVVKQRLDEIYMELKALSKSSERLDRIAKDVIQQIPEKPGQYHLSFSDTVLLYFTKFRKQMDSAANFLSVFTSKKQQKQYWNQAKKHGTSFTLNNERTVATQTG